MSVKLRTMAVGDRGRVTGFAEAGGSYREKLIAMGLLPGAEFTVTRVAPLGDPVEIRLRGFALSLRKADADAVNVEKIDE